LTSIFNPVKGVIFPFHVRNQYLNASFNSNQFRNQYIRKNDHNAPILLMTSYDDIANEHSILEDLHIVEGESIAVKISSLYFSTWDDNKIKFR
jgi:hypothetical protein